MQQKNFKRTTVTAALPYANGGVHIGHLAGVYVPADIYVRYLRLKKQEVVFIGGSDEHGVPITLRARKEGITPQDVVDRYHSLIKKSFEEFGISFDIYSRTTSATHHKLASDFFRRLYDNGKLIEKTTKQYYDEKVHAFLTDRDIVLRCVAAGRDPAKAEVKDVMSTGAITAAPGEDVTAALARMRSEQVRRLPVVEGETLVGMLSIADVARTQRYDMEAAQALSGITANVCRK